MMYSCYVMRRPIAAPSLVRFTDDLSIARGAAAQLSEKCKVSVEIRDEYKIVEIIRPTGEIVYPYELAE